MERKQAAREDQEVLKGREWVSGPWGCHLEGRVHFLDYSRGPKAGL